MSDAFSDHAWTCLATVYTAVALTTDNEVIGVATSHRQSFHINGVSSMCPASPLVSL